MTLLYCDFVILLHCFVVLSDRREPPGAGGSGGSSSSLSRSSRSSRSRSNGSRQSASTGSSGKGSTRSNDNSNSKSHNNNNNTKAQQMENNEEKSQAEKENALLIQQMNERNEERRQKYEGNDKVAQLLQKAISGIDPKSQNDNEKPNAKFQEYEHYLQGGKIWAGDGYETIKKDDIVYGRGPIVSDLAFKIISFDENEVICCNATTGKKYTKKYSQLRTGKKVDLCLWSEGTWRPAFMSQEIVVDIHHYKDKEDNKLNDKLKKLKTEIQSNKNPVNKEHGFIRDVSVEPKTSILQASIEFSGGLGIQDIPVYWLQPQITQVQAVSNYLIYEIPPKTHLQAAVEVVDVTGDAPSTQLKGLPSLGTIPGSGNDGAYPMSDCSGTSADLGPRIRLNLESLMTCFVTQGCNIYLLNKNGTGKECTVIDWDMDDDDEWIRIKTTAPKGLYEKEWYHKDCFVFELPTKEGMLYFWICGTMQSL